MSEIYDNWERLVRATLRREDLKLSGERTPSEISFPSSSSSISYIGFSSSSPLQVSSFNLARFFFGGIKAANKTFDPVKKGIAGAQFPEGFFNLQQILAATRNFDPKKNIGRGYGAVYMGVLRDGSKIAVKQLSVKSKQRAEEFINAIGTIHALEHSNIARLLGLCAEENQLLLVYKYMENLSLQHALFGPKNIRSKLNWQRRIKICLGVAKGLAFLHEESKLEIKHTNIKLTNILLDKDFTVKISDLEYSQFQGNTCSSMPRANMTEHMAPEYIQFLCLTPKADVYSFGVVVLEIVSGKQILTYKSNGDGIYLLDTAREYLLKQNLIFLVDPSLRNNYKYEEALSILNLAMQCVSLSAHHRPTMSEVVKVLEGMKIV